MVAEAGYRTGRVPCARSHSSPPPLSSPSSRISQKSAAGVETELERGVCGSEMFFIFQEKFKFLPPQP